MSSTSRPHTNLAAVLEQLQMSQGEVARRTGLARQTITDAYHGRPIAPLSWVKIAKALNVSVYVLAPAVADELDGVVVR